MADYNILNEIVESVLLDPVNTGANIVGANATVSTLKIAQRQLDIAQRTLDATEDNRDYQLEVRNLLHQILDEVIHLNQHMDMLAKK